MIIMVASKGILKGSELVNGKGRETRDQEIEVVLVQLADASNAISIV
jgi:hypothetical protein